MSDVHKYYLYDLGYLLKEEALGIRKKRDSEVTKIGKAFESGRLLAYYEVITTMQQQALGFGLPLSDLRLDDINPDKELL